MDDAAELARLRAENEQLKARLAGLEAEGAGDKTALLTSLLESVPAFVIRCDRALRITYINRLLPGLTLDQVVGTSMLHFIPEQYRELAEATVRRVMATGEAALYHTLGPTKGGGQGHYDTHVAPVREADGSFSACLIAVDTTAHRERQIALERSEASLRVALEATGIGFWWLDLEKTELVWDARMKAIVGRDDPVLIDRYVAEVVHPDDRAMLAEASRQVFMTGRWESRTHRIVRPSGEVRWVHSLGAVLREGDRLTQMVGGLLDVTESRRTEERFRRAQRFEAIGNLTAGIAHNFNNLLTVIIPALELVGRSATRSQAELLGAASHAARRASELVRQLMTFAGQRRGVGMKLERLDELVNGAVEISRRAFDRHITVELSIAPDLPMLRCNAGDLEQVLLNLLVNARDAVLESGRSSGHIKVLAGRSGPPPELPQAGAFVCISVHDDGVGLDDEARGRLFEPFFTTKDVGKGTGLGLATSWAIVREHGGVIECTSKRGEGTVFSIYLPASEQPGEAPAVVGPSRPARPVSVLIVDDEGLTREVVRAILVEGGHRALVAESGEHGVQMLAQHPEVDVVLLDRSMPGGKGDLYVGALRGASSRVKVAFFTGQETDAAAASLVDAVLEKPVTERELLATLARLTM